MTKKFGALASTMTTTARKALTLFLSFFIFPKPATPMHLLGGLMFVIGLFVKTVPSKNLDLRVLKRSPLHKAAKQLEEEGPLMANDPYKKENLNIV